MALNRFVKHLTIGDNTVSFPMQAGGMNRTTDMDYYVNGNTGSDDNDGSQAAPFKTLDRALEQWGISSGIYVFIEGGGTSAEPLVYNISKHYICDVMLHLIINADNVEIRWGAKSDDWNTPGSSGLYWYGGYLHLESNAHNVTFNQYTTSGSTHFEGATATVLADSSEGADLTITAYNNQSWQTVKGNMELINCTMRVPVSCTQSNLSLDGSMKYIPSASGSSLISATYGSIVTFRSGSTHTISVGSDITLNQFCYLAQGCVCSVNGTLKKLDGTNLTRAFQNMPLILKLNRAVVLGPPDDVDKWIFGYRFDDTAPVQSSSMVNGRYVSAYDDDSASPVRYKDGHVQYYSKAYNAWRDVT